MLPCSLKSTLIEGMQLSDLLESDVKVRPVVNQLEIDPLRQRREVTEYCAAHDLTVQTYGFLESSVLKHPGLLHLANEYSCTVPKVVLRWIWQCGFVPVTNGLDLKSIIANLDISRFRFSPVHMKVLEDMDSHDKCSSSAPTTDDRSEPRDDMSETKVVQP